MCVCLYVHAFFFFKDEIQLQKAEIAPDDLRLYVLLRVAPNSWSSSLSEGLRFMYAAPSLALDDLPSYYCCGLAHINPITGPLSFC